MKTFNFSAPSAQRGLWEKEVSAVEQNTATADQIPDISMSLQRIFPKKCPIMQQSILLHTRPGHALQI